MTKPDNVELSRRDVLAGTAASIALTTAPTTGNAQQNTGNAQQNIEQQTGFEAPVSSRLTLRVNGTPHELELDTRTTLLDALRDHLKLTGSKKGCDQGQCGACTVLVDGRRVTSCLTLAIMQQGTTITTIEGLGRPENLHPMQAAFIKHDGFQCGYCTPGQICSAVGMIDEIKAGAPSHVTADLTVQPEITPAEIRERMSGNICRCGAYSNIVDAVAEAAGRPT